MDIEALILALAKKAYMFEGRSLADFEGLIDMINYDAPSEIEGDPPVIEEDPVDINALPYNLAKVLQESQVNPDDEIFRQATLTMSDVFSRDRLDIRRCYFESLITDFKYEDLIPVFKSRELDKKCFMELSKTQLKLHGLRNAAAEANDKQDCVLYQQNFWYKQTDELEKVQVD